MHINKVPAGVAFLGGIDDYCISGMRIYNRTQRREPVYICLYEHAKFLECGFIWVSLGVVTC
jgi:hypothetical protein